MDKYISILKEKFGEEILFLNRFGGILDENGSEFKRNSAINQLYIGEFLKFYDEKIIPIKGISLLLKGFYGLGQRPMNDMDILVLPETFKSVEEKILYSNFRLFKNHKKYWYEKSYEKNNILKIDLHRALFYPYLYNIDLKELFSHRKRVTYGGKELYLLNDTFEVAILILSIVNNSFNVPLLNFYDVALILEKGDVDREFLKKICERWGIKKGLIFFNSVLYFLFEKNFFEMPLREGKKIDKLLDSLGKVEERRGLYWRKREFAYKFSLIKFNNVLRFFLFYIFKLRRNKVPDTF